MYLIADGLLVRHIDRHHSHVGDGRQQLDSYSVRIAHARENDASLVSCSVLLDEFKSNAPAGSGHKDSDAARLCSGNRYWTFERERRRGRRTLLSSKAETVDGVETSEEWGVVRDVLQPWWS